MTEAKPLDRRAAVAALLHDRGDLLLVSGLGSPTYDVMAAGDCAENFYLWGAMGGAGMVGLGLAIAQPDRPVVVITGDGDLLMGLGSLATVGVAAPANLSLVVLDNGSYGETGQQDSAAGLGLDLAAFARAAGFPQVARLSHLEEIAAWRPRLRMPVGPQFLHIPIDKALPQRVMPVRDGVFLKNRFRDALGLAPN